MKILLTACCLLLTLTGCSMFRYSPMGKCPQGEELQATNGATSCKPTKKMG